MRPSWPSLASSTVQMSWVSCSTRFSFALNRCIAVLGGRWKGGRVSLLTYLTDPGYQGAWALGLSAAYHGIPLVVQGLGMRWGGVGFTLSAGRRAPRS